MGDIKLNGYICERCKHTWISRNGFAKSGQKPLVCPACKSPYWNIPRKNNSKNKLKRGNGKNKNG